MQHKCMDILLSLVITHSKTLTTINEKRNDTSRGELEKLIVDLELLSSYFQHYSLDPDCSETLKTIQDLLKTTVSLMVKPKAEYTRIRSISGSQSQYSGCLETASTDLDTSTISVSAPLTSPSPPPAIKKDSTGQHDKNNELDSFSDSRRLAIESTIVSDTRDFPSFNDIAGLHEAKLAVQEALLDPVIYPEWFHNSDLRPWKAVLLFGPPGTGKSVLSQAIVKEIDSILYQVSSSDLISSWSGQSEKLIRELFDHAISNQHTNSVVFIDEIDSLCRVRSSDEDDANRRVKTELLLQIQRLQQTSGVILLCATNCPWDLDPAFLRRFEKKIHVGLPDLEARIAILKMRLKTTPVVVSVEWLAERTIGYSGDDLRRLCAELAYAQFRLYKSEVLKKNNKHVSTKVPLALDTIKKVISSFVTSVDEEQLARFQQYMTKK